MTRRRGPLRCRVPVYPDGPVCGYLIDGATEHLERLALIAHYHVDHGRTIDIALAMDIVACWEADRELEANAATKAAGSRRRLATQADLWALLGDLGPGR